MPVSQPCLGLVRRSVDGFVLLTEGDAPRLPGFRAPAIWFPAAVEPVARAARRFVGAPVHPLRLLLEGELRLWEIEAVPPLGMPGRGLRWAPREELERVAMPGPRHAAALRAWLREAGLASAKRTPAPWQRPGWLRQVREWITVHDPVPLSGPVALTPVRGAWPGSCVIRVGTARRARYFKATPLDAPPESALLRALSERWSRHLPDILAEAPERRWMLMRGLPPGRRGGVTWDDLHAALGLLARIQVDSVDRLQEPPFSALPQWRLETLAEDLAEAADRAIAWKLWPEAKGERCDDLLDLVSSMVRRLAELGIPDCVVHTDFHPGNLAQRRGQPVLLDWTEASRGHPFFSATRLLDYLPPEELDAWRPRLVEAYTAPWRRHGSAKALKEAFDMAERLHPARQAIRWRLAREVSAPNSPWRTIVEDAFTRALSLSFSRPTPARAASRPRSTESATGGNPPGVS